MVISAEEPWEGQPRVDGADQIWTALRNVSMQLRCLSISGDFMVLPSLFWPDRSERGVGTDKVPYWPHLEELYVTVNGRSFFNDRDLFEWNPFEPADPDDLMMGVNNDDEDATADGVDRMMPTLALEPTEFNNVIASASRAMLRMPKLNTFLLWCEGDEMKQLGHRIGDNELPLVYEREHTDRESKAGDGIYNPMAKFQKHALWEPPHEVLENWVRLCRILHADDPEAFLPPGGEAAIGTTLTPCEL